MRVLCVAEKPSMANELAKILSQGTATRRNGLDTYCGNWDFPYKFQNKDCSFTMTSIRGHLMSFDFTPSHRAWHSCPPLDLFDAPVEKSITSNLKDAAKNLQYEARNAQVLMIWTDCDREGENIGDEVASICKESNKHIRVYRARFSVIQPSHIHQACQNPGQLDSLQIQAVNTRTIIDLRIGAALTRFQTIYIQAAFPQLEKEMISYGSCQFPTLGFVVDQYERVEKFIPEPFWYIFLSYTKDGKVTDFNWKRNKLFDHFSAFVYYEICMDNPTAKVILKKEKPTSKWKPLPLTTVELQKAASKILKISSDETMNIAESLYNKGFISYPRTETDQFATDFQFQPLIEKHQSHPQWGHYANSLLNEGKFRTPRKGKNDDKAHPPIHPTAQVVNLEDNHKKIYEFITRRFLACCSDDAKGFQTDFEIELANEIFTTSGLVIAETNYLDIYTYEKWNAKSIPNLSYGETFIPTVLELREGTTSCPKLLSEAELIHLMDKNQIGTDATIQEHIKKILHRNYVVKEGAQQLFRPLPLGIGLVEAYNNIGLEKSLTKPLLRRKLEHQLKKICEGALQHQIVITEAILMYKEMYMKSFNHFNIIVNSLSGHFQLEPSMNTNLMASTIFKSRKPVMKCPSPTCSSALVIRHKNDNWSVGCQSFPSCKYAIWMDSSLFSNIDVTNEKCPRCCRLYSNLEVNYLNWTISDLQIINLLNSSTYIGCIRCDENIQNLFSIRETNSTSNTNSRITHSNTIVRNQSTTITRNNASSNSSTMLRTANSDQSTFTRIPVSNPLTPDASTPDLDLQRIRNIFQQNSSNTTTPQCQCNLECTLKTVSKEGPNKGREFYCCTKITRKCSTFIWADESNSNQSNTNSNRFPTSSTFNSSNLSNFVCYRCNQPGHFANNCPESSNFRSNNTPDNSSVNNKNNPKSSRKRTAATSSKSKTSGRGKSKKKK